MAKCLAPLCMREPYPRRQYCARCIAMLIRTKQTIGGRPVRPAGAPSKPARKTPKPVTVYSAPSVPLPFCLKCDLFKPCKCTE